MDRRSNCGTTCTISHFALRTSSRLRIPSGQGQGAQHMAINLLEMLSGSVGQSLVSQAGKFLGAPQSTMKSAVDAALPALLGGVMQKGATPEGASEVMKLLNTPGLESGITENLGSYLGGGEKTNSLLSMGSGLLTSLFGDKASGLVSTIG